MTNAVALAQGASNNVTMRNRIINGAMVIDQRNAGAAVTVTTSSQYGVDRWTFGWLTSSNYTVQQVADAPSGFNYSSKITIVSTTTANDVGVAYQSIEGLNALDLGWGTANAQPITLSFWVKANNTGTYCATIWFSGSTATYYYTAPYTVTTANTWQQIVLNVQGAPVGAGAFTAATNSRYMLVAPLTIGSSGQAGTATANTWSSSAGGNKTSGSFNLASTASATFQFTGVQLEAGTTASPFEYRQYGTELALCQRYYENNYGVGYAIGSANSYPNNYGVFFQSFNTTSGQKHVYDWFKVPKRAVPTVTYYDYAGNAGKMTSIDSGGTNTNNVSIGYTPLNQNNLAAGATATWYGAGFFWVASAEL
jgi:hypothetical protein